MKRVYCLTKNLGIQSHSIDPPLLFCPSHFPGMSHLYSVYKGLESMEGFLVIFASDWYWSQLNMDFLRELHDAIELSLSLRHRFQSRLKEEVEKKGHEWFMAELQEAINRLHDFLETGGKGWTVVSRKKRRKYPFRSTV